ncbi:MAG: hypothetical protein IT435_12895 [Phycisphaerales bacterium]|nr:hypothetical protein [Phycisphaerales bacterium]
MDRPRITSRGILREREIDLYACEREQRVCEVLAGGVLLMRPLVLHASRKSARPRHRRILHLEYASAELPGGLEWAQV